MALSTPSRSLGPTRRPLAAALALLIAAGAGCLRPPEREWAAPDPATPGAPALDEARAREAGLEGELGRLRSEIAIRDALLHAALLRHAGDARALEVAGERGAELHERLRAATAAVERLAAERKQLADALAEARARLELRDAEGAATPLGPPAQEPSPPALPPEPSRASPPEADVPAPVAIAHD